MSLINKMLNDLEKRDAFLNENPDQILDGLYSAYDIELKNKKESNNIFLLSLCLILLVSVASYIYIKQPVVNTVFNDVQQSGSSEILTLDDAEKESIEIDNTVPENENAFLDIDNSPRKYQTLKLDDQLFIQDAANSISKEKANRIESIQFETDSSGINLIMKMPDEIDYLVYGLTNPNRTVIEVENAELGFRLEDLQPVEPIVAIRYSINEENRFKLVLESNSPLTIKKSTTSEIADSHDLVVMMEYKWQEDVVTKEDLELADFVEKQVAIEKENVFKGDLIKTPVSSNSNAYAEKLFQEAYAEYKAGDFSESLKKLNMSLNHDSSHTKARSTLALVLSEKEHFELAYSVLNEGLIQYPENIEWIKMYARLLLNEGKLVEANAMLARQQPELALNTEYYAMQAAVLQQLAEYQKAAKIYRNLLHVNPHKGIWWMGLGISLESLKRYDDALYAYQKASSNVSLANDSREFIMQRINRLSNILKDEST